MLNILEEKIARLIDSKRKDMEAIADLKKEIIGLKKENIGLQANIEKLENSLLMQGKESLEMQKDNEQARTAVDELIGCIDALMKEEFKS